MGSSILAILLVAIPVRKRASQDVPSHDVPDQDLPERPAPASDRERVLFGRLIS